MKTTLTLTTALAVAMIAGHASSQELTYGAGSLSGAMISADGDEYDSFDLGGAVELTYDQFLFGASATHQNINLSSETTVTTYDGFAAYMPTNELMIGAGLTGLTVNDNDPVSGYEAFAQYQTGSFGTAVLFERPFGEDDDVTITTFYGEAAVTPEISVGGVIESISEIDETIFYLSADYDVGPVFARAFYNGVTDTDIGIFGARGSYDFGHGYFATAGAQQVDGMFGGEMTIYSVGGGYRINGNTTIDASFGQLFTDGADAELVRIGLNFEIGGRKRLDTRMRDAIQADFANGIGVLMPDLGFGGGLSLY